MSMFCDGLRSRIVVCNFTKLQTAKSQNSCLKIYFQTSGPAEQLAFCRLRLRVEIEYAVNLALDVQFSGLD